MLPVQEGRSAGRDLFLSEILIEEHWVVGCWPREVDVFAQAFRCCNAVLKGTLVKEVGRKFG